MDQQLRTYEDFEPASRWQHEEGSHILLIDLPGFNKEELKVQLDNFGNLKISGERQVDDRKWIRFRKDAAVPEDCNFSSIRARFEADTLFINMPKTISRVVDGQVQTLVPPKKPPSSEVASDQQKKYEEKHDDTPKKKPTSPRVVTEPPQYTPPQKPSSPRVVTGPPQYTPPQKPSLTSMPKTPQHVAGEKPTSTGVAETQQQYDDAKQKPTLTGVSETPKHEALQKPISTGVLEKPQYDKKEQEGTRQKLSPKTIAEENKKYGKEEDGTQAPKKPSAIVAEKQLSQTEKTKTIAEENKKYGKEEDDTRPQKEPTVIVAEKQLSRTEKHMEGSQSRQPKEEGSTAEKIVEKEKTPAAGPRAKKEEKPAGKRLESYTREGPALAWGHDKSKQLLVNVVAAMMVITTFLIYVTYRFASREKLGK